MVLGHEAVGIVEEVGSLVKNIKVGDKVIVPAITPDGMMKLLKEVILHKLQNH